MLPLTRRATYTSATGATTAGARDGSTSSDADGKFLTSLVGDAQQLSAWAQMTVDANADYAKRRREVRTTEPEWTFAQPTAIEYDTENNRLIVVDTQRSRLQIYNKLSRYLIPPAQPLIPTLRNRRKRKSAGWFLTNRRTLAFRDYMGRIFFSSMTTGFTCSSSQGSKLAKWKASSSNKSMKKS